MKKVKRKLFHMRFAISTFLLSLILTPVQSFGTGLSVHKMDNSGVTIEYEPAPELPVRTGAGVVHLRLQGGDIVKIPNSPETPVFIATVSVPPGSEPRVTLISREPGTMWEGTFPIYETPSDVAVPEIQSIANPVNQTLGQIELRTLGGIRIVRIPIYPARISDQPPTVELAKRIQIRVDFHSQQVNKARYKPAILNRLGRLVIANAEQAATWGGIKTSSFTEPFWPQGYLYRFVIDHEGIYRLTYEDMTSNGIALPENGIPSDQIHLYGNGGYELSLDPSAEAPLGLMECAVHVQDGDDGTFNRGDWLVFYGRDAGGWIFDTTSGWHYSQNHYTVTNTYWLNINPSGGGMRMYQFPTGLTADTTVYTAPAKTHLEYETFIYGSSNFIGTGRRWYGFTFDGASHLPFTVNLISPDTTQPADLRLRLVNGSIRTRPWIDVFLNQVRLSGFTPEIHTAPSEQLIRNINQHLQAGINTVAFEQSTPNAKALFDWLELSYHGRLDRSRIFYENEYPGVVKYEFSNDNLWIFDVTEPNLVRYTNGSSITVQHEQPPNRRYFALTANEFESISGGFQEYFPPESDIADFWSESNRADIVLITPDAYWNALEPLVEHYESNENPLRTVRIHLSEIYNRFSGGLCDPAAIRNMLHYAQNYWIKPPGYVLLCGDGDYNYRDIDRPKSEHFMPPYENGSTSSDDWFVDFNPGSGDLLPEIPIGRLTAASAYELSIMVEKIIFYAEEPEFGTWRNRITMVADDEYGEYTNDEAEHILGTEDICTNYLPSSIEIEKIYLTEYDRQWGRSKPQSGDDLITSINRGTLIVNYMGHGNPTLWAHERVFVQSRDLPRIEKSRRLPLYVAFTCDWAYWDNPSAQSFPEHLLAAPNGGAIGAIASTRLTYAYSNTRLAKNFFRIMFGNEDVTIGEILALAKHQAPISLGPTYHLLGDPALRLGSPRLRGSFQSLSPHPLIPLDLSSVTGRIFGNEGNHDPEFGGEVELVLLDTDVPRRYIVVWFDSQGNQHEIPLNYSILGTKVYQGSFSISNGEFDGRFIVPRDVTLNGQSGRLFGYFHNDEIDGIIALDSVGFAERVADVTDSEPPAIQIYFDHRGYRAGDLIGPEPLLILDLADSSGLNLTGVMGHGISFAIDGAMPVDITNSFRYNLDSYQSGSLEQVIGPLDPGNHNIEILAWDSFNNLAVKQIDVEVTDAVGGLMVDRVLNYPNPFRDETSLTFLVNKPANFEVQVYTVGGRLIWRYSGRADRAGLNSEATWNGRDHAGRTVSNGVYIYKVIAWDDEGNDTEGLGRIAFVR